MIFKTVDSRADKCSWQYLHFRHPWRSDAVSKATWMYSRRVLRDRVGATCGKFIALKVNWLFLALPLTVFWYIDAWDESILVLHHHALQSFLGT